MKLIRMVTITLALAIPAFAVARPLLHACCPIPGCTSCDGCPFCAHGR